MAGLQRQTRSNTCSALLGPVPCHGAASGTGKSLLQGCRSWGTSRLAFAAPALLVELETQEKAAVQQRLRQSVSGSDNVSKESSLCCKLQ